MYKSLPFLAAATLAAAACATGATTETESSRSNVIHEEELARVSHMSALEAVQLLRPVWLRVRGQPTFRSEMIGIRIYVDGTRRGDNADALQRIRASNVEEMQFLGAREATMRFGTDHQEGAILVSLKR